VAEIVMPRLSDSMEEGTVLRWLKSIGDEVAVGDELVEIETDKANMVYEADVAGTLVEIVAGEGETRAIGDVIARIGDTGDSNEGDSRVAVAAGAVGGEDQSDGGLAAGASALMTAARAPSRDGRAKASPIARRIARERGLDLAAIEGSGTGGRIIKADVEAALASGSVSTTTLSPPHPKTGLPPAPEEASTPSPAQAGHASPLPSKVAPSVSEPSSAPAGPTPGVAEKPETAKGQVEVVELTKLQQTVARRMAESKATAPHFYLQAEFDMTAAVDGRKKLKAMATDGEAVPTFNDMVVKACALALREFPRANGAYRDGKIELYSRINVGVAVAAQDALVVPTVFDADLKGLRQISTETRALASRVRDGQITPPELSGGTFTVSNLGMYGISNFSAVINTPQAGILAVGELKAKPVVRDSGEIEARQLIGVTLACDHRILYGADGAQFLARVRQLLEEPLGLAL
jgi:pyruvate dehydrogenase E2 component (dihydrolipoyllysine-residue acetyltransferase)